MSLDNRLRDILGEYGTKALLTTTEGFPSREPFIEKIKQAFADEGYKKVIDVSPDIALWGSKRLMTGEKWYSRFIENMREHGLDTFTPEETHMSREQIAFSRAIKSAKKASGLT